jgi:hypothetical protein
MNFSVVQRLRAMSKDEVFWRAEQAGRTALQRSMSIVRRPQWDRAHLREALAEGVVDYMFRSRTPPAWHQVHAELLTHLRERHSRFTLDPATLEATRKCVTALRPDAAAEATTRADRILANRYDMLGYRDLAFGGPDREVQWHHDPVHGRTAPSRFWADVPYLDPAAGDHKVIWELNRHQHWLQLGRALWLTGNARYANAIVHQLEHWQKENPPHIGINWASMLELGFRAMSWTWALHFILGDKSQIPTFESRDDSPWLVDMFVGLHHQLTHVEQNLSRYFSPNTHLTGEALALYVVGVALPELAGGARWAELGRTILLTESRRQIGRDGGHLERSTHYQRYTLDFYLMALLTARRDSDSEAVAAFSGTVERLADFTRTMADDEGRLPTIGDDDGGMLWPLTGRACNDVRDSLALAAVLLDQPDLAPWGLQEEVVWIAGPQVVDKAVPLSPRPEAIAVRSRTFADTGYVVVRDRAGTHAVVDVGRHGYLNGGHAHADALALTLTVNGRPFLVDPGTFTYTMDQKLRDQLRSSMSHNTISLQSRSIAEPAGPFHWKTQADAMLHASRHNDRFDWIEASHEAYAPLRVRRTLFRSPQSGWVVFDEIHGDGLVTASAHWHFDPSWTATHDDAKRLRVCHRDGDVMWLLHEGDGVLLAHGDADSGLGWHAPVYGQLVPAWTVRTTRSTAAPFAMATWMGAATGMQARPPELERLTLGTPSGHPVGLRVGGNGGGAVFLLRPGDDSPRTERDCTIADYQTDARVFHYATGDEGHLTSFALIDATHALALRDGSISIAAGDPIADLSGVIADGTLDLYATAPPPEMRVHGGGLRKVSSIRVNGREVTPLEPESDTVTLVGAAWTSPVRDLLPRKPMAGRMDAFAV